MSSIFEPQQVTAELTQGTKTYTKLCALEYNPETKIVKLIGGPTGFEDFPAEAWIKSPFDKTARGWLANFGGNGYPSCLIVAADINRAFQAWGLIS